MKTLILKAIAHPAIMATAALSTNEASGFMWSVM
jgi:hypothetical protein